MSILLKFDEPLESHSARVDVTAQWSDYMTGTSNPTNAFSNNVNSYATGNSAGELIWNIESFNVTAGQIEWFNGYNNQQVTVVYADDSTTTYRTSADGSWGNVTVLPKLIKTISLKVAPGAAVTQLRWNAIKVNSVQAIDNQPFPSDFGALNFAAGANMSLLEADDTVEQTATLNNYIFSDDLSSDGGFPHGDKALAFNGVIDSLNSAALNLNGGATFTFDMSKHPVDAGKTITMYVGNNMDLKGYNSADQIISMDTSPATNQVHAVSFIPAEQEITKLTFYSSGGATRLCGIEIDGVVLVDGDSVEATTTGTVGSITGTTVNLSSSSGTWTDGVNVTGPEKEVPLIRDTDTFLVNRSGSSYQVEAQNLMATIADDDLMLVNRSGQSYKVTGAEVKAELGGGGGGGGGDVDPSNAFAVIEYAGTGAEQDLDCGLDMLNDGGMMMIYEKRTTVDDANSFIFDTKLPVGDFFRFDQNHGTQNVSVGLLAWTTTGCRIGSYGGINQVGKNYIAAFWKQSPGFFEVIEYTASGSTTTVPHTLGRRPAMIWAKNKATGDWCMFNEYAGASCPRKMNSANYRPEAPLFAATPPTDTDITFGDILSSEHTPYHAYVFGAANNDTSQVQSGTYIGGNSNVRITAGPDTEFMILTSLSTGVHVGYMDKHSGITPGAGKNPTIYYNNKNDAGNKTMAFDNFVAEGNYLRIDSTNPVISQFSNSYTYYAITGPKI